MASRDSRMELIKDASPIFLFEHIDEENMVGYQLVFFPSIGMFKILSTLDDSIPNVAVSYDMLEAKDFINSLNKRNKLDSIILMFVKMWDKLDESRKISFADEIPLNASYLGQFY